MDDLFVEKEYLRLGPATAPLIVKMSSFQGARYLDIRRYYLEKVKKEIKPTPKGVSLKEDEVKEIIALLAARTNEIHDDFVSNISATESAVRGQRREKVARSEQRGSGVRANIEVCPGAGTGLFSVENNGSSVTIKLNKNNRLIASLGTPEAIEAVGLLLRAFIAAKNGLDFSRKVDADTLTTYLELEWGNLAHSIQDASDS